MRWNRKIAWYTLFNVFLPLVVGGLFYFIFCPEVFWVRRLDILLHINGGFRTGFKQSLLIRICRNHLLDFLWLFAMNNTFFLIYNASRHAILLSSLSSISIGVGFEMLQYFRVVAGTYDVIDILVEGSAALISALIIKKTRRNIYEKESKSG